MFFVSDKVLVKRLLRAMRITTVIMLVGCMHVAAKTSSQVITFSGKNVPLKIVFAEIRKQAGFTVAYNADLISVKDVVTVNAVNTPLEEFLDQMLTPQRIDYLIKRNTIFLSRSVNHATEEVQPREVDEKIEGRVVDENGQPLIGATVKGKRSHAIAVTNENGQFSIKIASGEILICTYVGHDTREIRLTDAMLTRGSVTIALTKSITALDEVEIVNKGYYAESKRFLTGNVSKVTAKEIEKQPVSNPLAALMGRVPGLQIIQQTGVPGGNFQVRIRGQNSLNNGNEPLYIVDGVPFTSTSLSNDNTASFLFISGTSPLNGINPADIESIEVLKDADATAIYGSRGANGVILITTKKGQRGPTKIDFNYYSGFGNVATKVDLLNTQEYLVMRREAFQNDGIVPTPGNPSHYDVTGDWGNVNQQTDWQKELIGETSTTNDAQITLSGSENNISFNLSGNYHRETAVFPGEDADKRIGTHLNVTSMSYRQRLKISATINYTQGKNQLPRRDLTNFALTLPPNAPKLFDVNGNLNWQQLKWRNPLSYLKETYESNTNTLIGQLSVSYQLIKNIDVKILGGFTEINTSAISLVPRESRSPEPISAGILHYSNFSNGYFKNWTIEPQVQWKKSWRESRVEVLTGSSLLSQRLYNRGESASGFASASLMCDIRAASTYAVYNSQFSEYKYAALFGRVNLNVKDRYILNITARRDGSSRYGENKRFAVFGAAGAAWLFYNEQFFQPLTWLSFGKIRGSYGITGNDQLTEYTYLDAYTSSELYQGVPGLNPVRLSNDEFSWEVNKKFEAGLELGFLQDRFLLSASFYSNRSSNQLIAYALPPTTGFESIQDNFPATVLNQGVELILTGVLISDSRLLWKTSVNATIPKNKLLKFPNLESFPSSYRDRYVIGQPLNIIKLFHYKGVDPQTGIYQFEDINNDGIFSKIDRTIIKTSGLQKVFGGIHNTVEFKNFQLDIFIQLTSQTGNSYFSYINDYNVPGLAGNLPADVMRRWRHPKDNTDIQLFSTGNDAATAHSLLKESDRSITDASFARLKNVSLAYSFGKTALEKLKVRAINLFVRSQNLFTLTKYKGSDPEFQTGTQLLPPLKVIVAGFNVTF